MSHAYAIIPDPERPGKYFSAHLTGVSYKGLKHLEPSERSESIGTATERLNTAVSIRSRTHKWNEGV